LKVVGLEKITSLSLGRGSLANRNVQPANSVTVSILKAETKYCRHHQNKR